jgi:hypothetical protein
LSFPSARNLFEKSRAFACDHRAFACDYAFFISPLQPHRSGKVARLPWSFKPEQARGVYIFRANDEESGEVVWQIGIGHGDTKTKPKRLIMSDVDGQQIKVISPKGSRCPFRYNMPCFHSMKSRILPDYFSYPQFFNFADAKAAFSVGAAKIKALWQSRPHAESTEKSGWTSDFHDCEVRQS